MRCILRQRSEFVAFARHYAQVLIAERFLPDDEKSVRPLPDAAGLSGMSKFLHGHCFFKVVHNGKPLFGSDALAEKAVMNEMRGGLGVEPP